MTMAQRALYVVVSEGASERAYLQMLRSFLVNHMPLCDDLQPRLNFIPKITNDGVGGGAFSLVRKTYLACRKADRRTPIAIWVDMDIYVRNGNAAECRNARMYAQKGALPDFMFSVMNFEDFLALHFDDDLFEQWYNAMRMRRHFATPLRSADYAPIFAPIWTSQMNRKGLVGGQYAKGDMPANFISDTMLRNMMRHARDQRMAILFRKYTMQQTFAEFLAACLQEQYPDVF